MFQWTELQAAKYPELSLLYAVPNGGKRDKITGARMKAEGVKPGIPDICLPVARGGYHGLYIELKRLKGGSTSANQSAWIESLREQGYAACVCKGWEAAKDEILRYLRGNT